MRNKQLKNLIEETKFMKIQQQTWPTLRAWMVSCLTGMALIGCGGGSGGGGAVTESTTTAILDSFGVAVENGFGAGDSGGDGTAGDGAAIPNSPVLLTDATGKTATATTNAQGYYRMKLTGFTPPFVLKVTKPDGSTRTSLSTAALKTNGFITINITGLTEKIASDVAIAGGKKGAFELTPAIVTANASVIQTSINNLKTQLASQIAAAGVNPATFDPIAVPFKTDSTGYDKILDSVKVTLAADGSTVVTAVATTTTTTTTTGFSGNWRLNVNNSGQSFDGGLVPGSSVLTQAAIANVTVATAASAALPSQASIAGYTVTSNGSTSTLTGPGTNLTIQITGFNYSSYSQSGSGGVGTRVTYTLNISFTYNGTLEGTSFNNLSLSPTIVYTYTREN